ncbi:hypothetical protein D3C81_2235410 [compost metagenome]
MLPAQLFNVAAFDAVDFDAVVEIHFFDQIDSGFLGFLETGQYGEDRGSPERVRRKMHLIIQS